MQRIEDTLAETSKLGRDVRRKTLAILVLPLFIFALICPSGANALPYIPLLFAASSIFYQILLLAAMYIPFAFRIVRRSAVMLGFNPAFRRIAAILPAVLLITWAVMLRVGGSPAITKNIPTATLTRSSGAV